MNYTQQHAKDFWIDFDNQTLFQRTPEFSQAIGSVLSQFNFSLDGVYDAFRLSFLGSNYPQEFENAVSNVASGLVQTAELQQAVMTSHFGSDLELIQRSMEDFGQGVLYDNRPPRPRGRYIHKMDGEVGVSMVGYHRWYGFIQGGIVMGANSDFWNEFSLFMGLAWAIQTEMKPQEDNPNNPPMDEGRLNELRGYWLNLSQNELNRIFAENGMTAPAPPNPTDLSNESLNYKKIQQILGNSSLSSSPIHGGQGKFWDLSYEAFINLEIYGHALIEKEGENRGTRSSIVKVLKGELAGMPQMPLNRPPLSPDSIQLIIDWINAGYPENSLAV
jgi:hypothetical protein